MSNKKITLITGASSGIGEGLSKKLAKDGDIICLLARRKDRLKAVQASIQENGGKANIYPCDMTDTTQLKATVQEILATHKRIDRLILNAGVGLGSNDWQNIQAIKSLFQTNLIGAIELIHLCLPHMQEQGQGHIIGISSLASYISLPGRSSYASSKAGLRLYLEGLRRQVRPDIQVTTICPGFIKTDLTARNQHPMPFLMDLDPAVKKMV